MLSPPGQWREEGEFISVLKRQRIMRPIEIAAEIQQRRNTRITTPKLNAFLKETYAQRSFFTPSGNEIKINYFTQVGSEPPALVFFSNSPDDIKESHKRFIERNLRKRFDFEGTPIKLFWRTKHKNRS